jgi:uncharacterized membrane protein
MKKTSLFTKILIIVASILPLIYLASFYQQLPASVPVHFGFDGTPDRYDTKSTLIFTTLLISLVGIGTYFLMINLPAIDPKKTAGQSPEFFQRIGLVVIIFLSALNMIILSSSINSSFNSIHFIMPLIGLMFAFLGNYMHTLKPNYFAGIRTPWTLENSDNWRETHLLSGKLWVAGGIGIVIESLLLPNNWAWYLFAGITCLIVIIPIIFSYRYYKTHQQ